METRFDLQAKRIKLMDELRAARIKMMKTAGRNFSAVHRKQIQEEITELQDDLDFVNKQLANIGALT